MAGHGLNENTSSSADWFYVGHYGQLGPLTFDQMEELIRDGVVEQETYVWKNGMADWVVARQHLELRTLFSAQSTPPLPPPLPVRRTAPPVHTGSMIRGYDAWPVVGVPKSDRKRWIAGLLQLIIPGTGRMYLGYAAQGVIQFILFTPCGLGVGWLWSIIDGILILTGSVKLDGYGRLLED